MIIKKNTDVPEDSVKEEKVKNVKRKILIGPDDGSHNIIMRHFKVLPEGNTPFHSHDHEHVVKIENGKGMKNLKKYRLKSRINKGEKFVLESFEWKAPSMRKGLFGSHKQKSIEFYCRIIDNLGEINDSLIGKVETPRITVFKK